MPTQNSERMHTQITQELFKYCMFNLRNRELAEDCVSETYVRWLSKPDSPAGYAELKAWLIGIARNVIKEKYRESIKTMTIDTEPTINDATSETAMDDQLVTMIKKELDKLDELAREIVVLKIWEEFTFAQIAEITGENENNCKSIYYRSLETIKIALGEKKKGKKLYAVPVPLIISGVQALSRKPQLQVSNQFVATSWENASLRERFLTINNLTIMRKALNWLKAHKLAAIFGICVLLAIVTISAILLLSNQGNQGTTLPSTSSSTTTMSSSETTTTTTVSSTTLSTTTPTSSVSLTKVCENSTIGLRVSTPSDWECFVGNGPIPSIGLRRGTEVSIGMPNVRDMNCGESCTVTEFYNDGNTKLNLVRYEGKISSMWGNVAVDGTETSMIVTFSDEISAIPGREVPYAEEIKAILGSITKI